MTTRSSRRDAGVALIIALLFVVVLTAIVTSFVYETQVDATAVAYSDSDFAALLSAKSSFAEALSVLEADLLNNKSIYEEDEFAEIVDSLDDLWASPPQPMESNGATGQVTITDEYGKINLNALLFEETGKEQEYVHLESALRVLFQERGMAEDPVDAILDWLDSDDDVRPNGYESSYYSGLDHSYEAKNGPMDSIEELLLIPGITADVYFGTDEQAGGVPLPDLLTVHGHPQGMVNINTAPEEVLVALLAARDDPLNVDIAGAQDEVSLISERLSDAGPYDSMPLPDNLNPVAPVTDPDDEKEDDEDRKKKKKKKKSEKLPPAHFFDIRSSVFRVQADAVSGNAQVRVQAYVWRATDEFAAEQGGGDAKQMFRIVGWQVIR